MRSLVSTPGVGDGPTHGGRWTPLSRLQLPDLHDVGGDESTSSRLHRNPGPFRLEPGARLVNLGPAESCRPNPRPPTAARVSWPAPSRGCALWASLAQPDRGLHDDRQP